MKKKKPDKSGNLGWIIKITLFSVAASAAFTLASQRVLAASGYIAASCILVLFIAVGVLFDIIGISSAAAREAPFNAMASHRVRGSFQALWLIRNSSRVSSVCNDVVGDISGIVSGATAAFVAARIAAGGNVGDLVSQILVSCVVTGLTIAGKAVGKIIAMKKTNAVLLRVGLLMSLFWRRKGQH